MPQVLSRHGHTSVPECLCATSLRRTPGSPQPHAGSMHRYVAAPQGRDGPPEELAVLDAPAGDGCIPVGGGQDGEEAGLADGRGEWKASVRSTQAIAASGRAALCPSKEQAFPTPVAGRAFTVRLRARRHRGRIRTCCASGTLLGMALIEMLAHRPATVAVPGGHIHTCTPTRPCTGVSGSVGRRGWCRRAAPWLPAAARLCGLRRTGPRVATTHT